MAIASSTLMAIGMGLSAFSAISQGQAAKDQADYQAAIQRQQAEREQQLAQARARDFEREESAKAARRRAAMGASGTRAGTGSNLLVDEDFEAEKELNMLRILNGGDVMSMRLNQQADLNQAAGKSARTAGFMRAGASLMTGMGKNYGGGGGSSNFYATGVGGDQSSGFMADLSF